MATITFNNVYNQGIQFVSHAGLIILVLANDSYVLELIPGVDTESKDYYVSFYNRLVYSLNSALELNDSLTVSYDIPGDWGGSGTSNYNSLHNLPSIDGITLIGNKTLSELGGVQSFNGRSGSILPIAGDYTADAIELKIPLVIDGKSQVNVDGALNMLNNSSVNKNIVSTGNIETIGTAASQDYTQDSYFFGQSNGVQSFYRVISTPIYKGDTLVEGTNCMATTLGKELGINNHNMDTLSSYMSHIFGMLPFSFGIDPDTGEYGYIKDGADTVTPFKSDSDFRLTLTVYGTMYWGYNGYDNLYCAAYRDIVIECIDEVPTVKSVNTSISGMRDSWSQTWYYIGWRIISVTVKSFELLA